MHIILKSHVNELSKEFEYNGFSDSKLFEFFCNYCVVSKHYLGRFNPQDVTTEEDDASIDGIAIVIDGDLMTSVDDAIEIFKTHKTNLSVDIIFTQVKSGEQFKKQEINNFKVGLEDFLSLDPKMPNGKFNQDLLEIFKVVFENLNKIRNRRPNILIYYCTSGVYKKEREIKSAFDIILRFIKGTDFFHEVSVEPLGRTELLKLYTHLTEKNEAKLKLIDYFGMPEMPGIPQSYVGIVNASHFVESLLLDHDENLRQSVFEENVRSFLGKENTINAAIQVTINDKEKAKLFSVLNNGVTIVAPELTLTPNTKEVNLINYQIINGCQTSSTLYENREFLTDSVNLVVKIIESPSNDSSEDIISATNSQSNIQKEAFYGLKNKAKLVQKYFNVKNNDQSPENKMYFERRQGEFRSNGFQASKVFDVREVARCYAAMFLNQPHNSARYVKTIFAVSGNNLFADDDHESYYYVAALTLYKYKALINGKRIGSPRYQKLRWHIIQIFKWYCHKNFDVPLPNSKAADKYAQTIIDILNSEDKLYIQIFEECQNLIDTVGFPTDDSLKRGKFAQDLMTAVQHRFRKK